MAQYRAAWHGTVQRGTAPSSAAQNRPAWHGMARHRAGWHGTARQGTAGRQLTVAVTLVAGLALGERVGLGAEGAGLTGGADAVVAAARAGGAQERPWGDSGGDGEHGHPVCRAVPRRAALAGPFSPAGHWAQHRPAFSTQFMPAGQGGLAACLRGRGGGRTGTRCPRGTARSRHPGGCDSLAARHSAATITCGQTERRDAGSPCTRGRGGGGQPSPPAPRPASRTRWDTGA